MNACPTLDADVGIIRDLLGSVDCNVQFYSAAGYRMLTAPGSPLPAAVTAMLTIYVAILGLRMMFGVGSTRLSETPLIALKIGIILALTLNWSLFQTLVFDVDTYAPLEIGRLISRPMANSGSTLAADPVKGLQTAYDEMIADAGELGKKVAQGVQAQPSQVPQSAQINQNATASGLRVAADVLVASSAGVLAMAFITLGVLTALGPIFVALFLFDATRGLFVGWIRALVATMLTPMVCWFGASLLLVVIGPRIETLAQQRAAHAIDINVATSATATVLVFAAAQGLLIVVGILLAGGFELRRRAGPVEVAGPTERDSRTIIEPAETRSRAEVLAGSMRRSPAAVLMDYASPTVMAGEAGAAGRDAASSGDGPARPARLGETYRRGAAMRDRNRVGAAGRA